MVATGQSTHTAGNDGWSVAVGRDFVVANTYAPEQDGFFSPNLESVQDDIAPQITADLAARARRQRLLVLGGQYEDKFTIARHTVACLRDILRHDAAGANGHAGGGRETPVLQWNQGEIAPNPAARIRREETPTVFFLPNILPQHVNYNLDEVHAAALAGQHYVVATTERPASAWKLSNTEQAFWYALHSDQAGLFGADDLVTALIVQLQRSRDALPAGLFVESYEPAKSQLGGMGLEIIAERLRTPHNVRIFVQLLCKQPPPVKPEILETLIRDAINTQNTIKKWYHTVLTPHEQLLALSLSFFDGLLDDQFFAALEQLVRHIRTHRDMTLRSFDYCDIDPLGNFFNLIGINAVGTRFESRLANQRSHTFKAAWDSHRRQIIHALPILTGLTIQSVDNQWQNWELYGTYDRRDNLRRAIGDTLSDIGLISSLAVQDALLQLAAHNNMGVQAVAARALARWREYNDGEAKGDQRLFEVLESWQRDTRVLKMLETILAGQDDAKSETALSYIRATIALTVSYAAGYDEPNHLAPELQAQIRHLAQDPSKMVRARLREHMLPRVVLLHLKQLRGLLAELTRYIDLTQAIGASLAFAFEANPQDVLETLDLWHRECQIAPTAPPGARITARDALLITLAFTYGEIDYGDHPQLLTANEGFKRLQEILATERHPKVREAVVIAISRQASRHFARVEPLLQNLVAEVPEAIRPLIVNVLGDVYLDQRKQLPNGPRRLTIQNAPYPVWVDGPRPLTLVESAMYRWIKDPRNMAAQHIAVQSSITFARRLDQAEAEQITQFRLSQQRSAAEPQAAPAPGDHLDASPARQRRYVAWYVGRYVPWLATWRAPEYRWIVSNLLPEALNQRTSDQAALEFVLAKWNLVTDPAIKEISVCLRRALAWYQKGWLLLAGAVLMAFLLIASL